MITPMSHVRRAERRSARGIPSSRLPFPAVLADRLSPIAISPGSIAGRERTVTIARYRRSMHAASIRSIRRDHAITSSRVEDRGGARAAHRATARNQLWLLGRHPRSSTADREPEQGWLGALHALGAHGLRLSEMRFALPCSRDRPYSLSLSPPLFPWR